MKIPFMYVFVLSDKALTLLPYNNNQLQSNKDQLDYHFAKHHLDEAILKERNIAQIRPGCIPIHLRPPKNVTLFF